MSTTETTEIPSHLNVHGNTEAEWTVWRSSETECVWLGTVCIEERATSQVATLAAESPEFHYHAVQYGSVDFDRLMAKAARLQDEAELEDPFQDDMMEGGEDAYLDAAYEDRYAIDDNEMATGEEEWEAEFED